MNVHVMGWTHPSVLQLANGNDPIRTITERARGVVFAAIDAGWAGPPFDPVELAAFLKIPVVQRGDIRDAQIVPSGQSVRIEYNPNRPKRRIRFSVAHEIGHTLFPDCAAAVRHRRTVDRGASDDWQLELLCNIAAAEILMPLDALPILDQPDIDIDDVLSLSKRFEVSVESLLLRMSRLTSYPLAVFAAAKTDNVSFESPYRLDYVASSRAWQGVVPGRGSIVEAPSVMAECSAVGFTAKGTEVWPGGGEYRVECVGIPAYPGHRYPRVVGMLRPTKGRKSLMELVITVRGDATEPRGSGPLLLVHVVNDKTPRWGAGFARAVRSKWRDAQADFIDWVSQSRSHLSLGNVHAYQVRKDLTVIHMIAQRGYGPAPKPRIRYEALRSCLQQVADFAGAQKATVHMPRIGSGQAGGRWEIVSEIIGETLSSRGVPVVVYDLPGADKPKDSGGENRQLSLT